MGTVLLVLVVVLVIAGLVYGVVTLLAGEDPGMSPADPDGRARPLPNNRSLSELDLKTVRFDVGFRGYRMTQVDRVLRRTAYDIGYKDEMIAVLEAEVIALREGRVEDAELLRKAREAAAAPPPLPGPPAGRVATGAHRADESDDRSDESDDRSDESDDTSVEDAEDVENAEDVDNAEEMPERADGEPGGPDATAPGLLNRAALRGVNEAADHGSPTDASPFDSDPPSSASSSASDQPSSSDQASSSSDSSDGASDDADQANGAQWRARA
jgi:DivIVA domain-containing protein